MLKIVHYKSNWIITSIGLGFKDVVAVSGEFPPELTSVGSGWGDKVDDTCFPLEQPEQIWIELIKIKIALNRNFFCCGFIMKNYICCIHEEMTAIITFRYGLSLYY